MCEACEAVAERGRAAHALAKSLRGFATLDALRRAFPLDPDTPAELAQLAARLDRGQR